MKSSTAKPGLLLQKETMIWLLQAMAMLIFLVLTAPPLYTTTLMTLGSWVPILLIHPRHTELTDKLVTIDCISFMGSDILGVWPFLWLPSAESFGLIL